MILTISKTKLAAMGLEEEPIRVHNSKSMRSFFSTLDSLHLSQQKSRAINIPTETRSEGNSEIKDCINIMEIRRSTLDTDSRLGRLAERGDSLLADKISKLHIFFSLLKTNITEEQNCAG